MSLRSKLDTCAPSVRIPGLGDNIYKDECCFSFETPESEDGLYICLCTFLAFSKKYLDLYYSETKNRLFLQIKKVKKELPVIADNEETAQKPKRLAIGVEGGFEPDKDDKFEYKQIENLYLLPEHKAISFEDLENIHSVILASVSGVLSSTSAANKEEILAWDGEKRDVSKHAEGLKQLDNGVKVPPSGWKCCMCDLESNLWMNLSDGSILCGRRYFDGSGGNNHAVEHFQSTGFPLAVKLGTITASGADVYSYDEDCMVEDPGLAGHLAHFGINMMNMEKTEQTMTEMEIELNQKVGSEWDLIQEAGENLKELFGPGLTGIRNMGNTCYMNSILQVLLTVPNFHDVYADSGKCTELFKTYLTQFSPESGLHQLQGSYEYPVEIQKKVENMMSDFKFHMCKLGYALNNPMHEIKDGQKPDIALPWPRYLKRIIGKGHSEFSTNRQQDAHEFLLHILNVMERSEHKKGQPAPGHCFKFFIQDRVQCQSSSRVKYSYRPDYVLSLPIPMDKATNPEELKAYEKRKEDKKADVKVEVGEVVRAEIPHLECVRQFTGQEIVEDFYSAAIRGKGTALKSALFASFPDYLIVHLKKFTVGDDWVPKKLDVSIDMPDNLDLTQWLGEGARSDELLMPEGEEPEEHSEEQEQRVREMQQVGFPQDKCWEAVKANPNASAEEGIYWLMEKYPNGFPEPEAPATVSDENVLMITSMGFSKGQATKALRLCKNNVERAADWIFNHMDDMGDDEVAPKESTSEPKVSQAESKKGLTIEDFDTPRNTTGRYELIAFISHMGSSTMSGHYVCHIKKGERWVIFNDEKVAESKNPPKNLGYIYFYRRIP